MKIRELRYASTNTYLIEGERGKILWDTGWAGTFPAFCAAMGELKIPVQDIDHVFISHFHPDHMGIAQNIAGLGPVIVVCDVQRDHVHSSDDVFLKEKSTDFMPVKDDEVKFLQLSESRDFLRTLGINGEILYTPGHSDDSISLCLDEGDIFVGDLNPYYEIEILKGTETYKSWEKLMARRPKRIYYGHARSAAVEEHGWKRRAAEKDLENLVSKIMRFTDRSMTIDKIQVRTGADRGFIEDVVRMYLTHRDVGVKGILDRIEIKGR